MLTWRRVRDGIYSEEDKNAYLAVDKWFKDNLPEPPFYGDNNDNPGKIIYEDDYQIGVIDYDK